MLGTAERLGALFDSCRVDHTIFDLINHRAGSDFHIAYMAVDSSRRSSRILAML
jgi:hypothetical protein